MGRDTFVLSPSSAFGYPIVARHVARLYGATPLTTRPRTLERVRVRRSAAAVAAATAIAALLSGCRQTASLSRQEVVVVFKPDATQADHARVYAACKNLPGISPEPMVTESKYLATLQNNVRYRVDSASNYQLQQLYKCLGEDPSVAGYKPPSDQGQ
jgi:hypothetical protein